MNNAYKRTTIGCFIGIFTQAVITNLTAILFVPMMTLYGLDYRHLGLLVLVNFVSQITADLSFSKVIDKVGYRKVVLPTCILAFAGLFLFAATPFVFAQNFFPGLLVSTFIFAFASGLMEIMLSPIVAASSDGNKGPAMSLMHSFYAWGQAVTIIVTTLLLSALGQENWPYIVLLWMFVPLTAFVLFVRAPFPDIVPEQARQTMSELMRKPYYLLTLLAIFLGAGAELVMNQYASVFMEKGLSLPKLTGDLAGMCGFAVFMGIGRTLYGLLGAKIDLSKVLIGGSLLACLCYVAVALTPFAAVSVIACVICGLAVSLLWPGTIVLASDRFPMAGAWMFAILAAAGDIGAATAPWLTGEAIDGLMSTDIAARFSAYFHITAEQGSLRLGLLLAAVIPLLSFFCHVVLHRYRNKPEEPTA